MNVPIYQVLAHTPPWVFGVFIYLTTVGLLRLRCSIRPLGRIWISPCIFVVWGLVGLFRRQGDFESITSHWVVGAAIGGVVGSLGGMRLIVDRPRRLVRLPGSWLPLFRILVIFGAHYVLQVAAAVNADRRAAFLTWDVVVSGASAGYFLAWAARFLRNYRTAPQADLAPSAPRTA